MKVNNVITIASGNPKAIRKLSSVLFVFSYTNSETLTKKSKKLIDAITPKKTNI